MAYIAGDLIQNEHYNSFITDVIEVWGDTHSGDIVEATATYGYGQKHTLTLKSDGEKVLASDWDELVRVVNAIAQFQASVIGSIPTSILLSSSMEAISDMAAAITTIKANKLIISESNLVIPTILGSSLVSSFSGAWIENMKHEFTMNFTSWDMMRNFFNSGGQIRFSPKFSTNSSATNDLNWVALFDSIDYIKMDYTNTTNIPSNLGDDVKGFYDLTNVPVTIFTKTVSGMTFNVKASLLGSAGNTGSIQFQLNWNSPAVVSSGLVTSNIDIVYANGPLVYSTPPTFSSVTPLSPEESGDPSLTLGDIPDSILERESQRERLPYPAPLSYLTIDGIIGLDFTNIGTNDPEYITLDVGGVTQTSNYIFDPSLNLEVMTARNKLCTIKVYRNPSDRYNITRYVEINSDDLSDGTLFTFTYHLKTKTGIVKDFPITINITNRMMSWSTESSLFYSVNVTAGGNIPDRDSALAISDDGVYVMTARLGNPRIYKKNATSYAYVGGLLATGVTSSDLHLTSIACSSDASRIVTGYPTQSVGGNSSGAVYIYKMTSPDVWALTNQILPPVQKNTMNFGVSVDISDDGLWMVVGADTEDNVGAIYVYRRTNNTDTWTFQNKFINDVEVGVSANGRRLGNSVAISGKDQYNNTLYAGYTIIAGKPFNITNPGSIHQRGVEIYKNTSGTFSFSQNIYNPRGLNGDSFGYDVDISNRGDFIVIGCPNFNTGTIQNQFVDVYKKGNNGVFQLKQSITNPSILSNGPAFGTSVSIGHDGRTIAIGGSRRVTTGIPEVNVYHKTSLDVEASETWSNQITLHSPVGTTGRYGKVALATLNNDIAVIGTGIEPYNGDVFNGVDTLYVYDVIAKVTPLIIVDAYTTDKENLRDEYTKFISGQFTIGNLTTPVTEYLTLGGVEYLMSYSSNVCVLKTALGYVHITKTSNTSNRIWKYYPEYNITSGYKSVNITIIYSAVEPNNQRYSYSKTLSISPSKYATTALSLPSRIHNTIDYGIPTLSGGFTSLIEGSNNTDADFFTVTNNDVRETWNILTQYYAGDVVRYDNKWYSAIHNILGGVSPDVALIADWVEVNSSDSLILSDNRYSTVYNPRYAVSTSSNDINVDVSPKIGNAPQAFSFKFKAGTGDPNSTIKKRGITFSSVDGVYPRATSLGHVVYDEQGVWSPSRTYKTDDIVTASDGLTYRASASGYGDNPVLQSDSGINGWTIFDHTSNVGLFGSNIQIKSFVQTTHNANINAGKTRYDVTVSGRVPYEHIHHIELTGVFYGETVARTVNIGYKRLYRDFARLGTTGVLGYTSGKTYAVNDMIKNGSNFYKANVAGAIAAPAVNGDGNWSLAIDVARIDETNDDTTFYISMDDSSSIMVDNSQYEIKTFIRPLTGNFTAGYYGDLVNDLNKTSETTNKRVGYFGLKSYSSVDTYASGVAYPERIMGGCRYNLYSIPCSNAAPLNSASQRSMIVLEVEGDHAQSSLAALSLFGKFGECLNPNSTGLVNPNVPEILVGITVKNNGTVVNNYAPSPFFPSDAYTSYNYDLGDGYYVNRTEEIQLVLKPSTSDASNTIKNTNNMSTSITGDEWANVMTDFQFIPYANGVTTWKWINNETTIPSNASNSKRFIGSFLPHNNPYTFRIYENSDVYTLSKAKTFININDANYNVKVGFSDILSKNNIHNTSSSVATLAPLKIRDGIIKEVVTMNGNIAPQNLFSIVVECEDDINLFKEIEISGIFYGDTTSSTFTYDVQTSNTNTGHSYLNRYYTINKAHTEDASNNRESSNYRVWEFFINFGGDRGLMVEGNDYTFTIKQTMPNGSIASGQAEDTTLLPDNIRYRSVRLNSKGNNILEDQLFYDFKYSAHDADTNILNTTPHKDISYVAGMSLLPTHTVMPIANTWKGGGQEL